MTRILHFAKKPLNGHPTWLAELQRRMGDESKTTFVMTRETGSRPYPCDIKWTHRRSVYEWLDGCQVLHLHDTTLNDPDAAGLAERMPHGCIVVEHLYHEAQRLPPQLRRSRREPYEFACQMARKGALLDRTSIDQLVPVVVPHWRQEMLPLFRRREVPKLVFTPTTKRQHYSYRYSTNGKGYVETLPVLERLGKEGIITYQIYNALNWRETMAECAEADIRLDEVVTGNYGMATIEGLAMGCVTISGMTPELGDLLADDIPIVQSNLEQLEDVIRSIAVMAPAERHEIKQQSVEWIREHYSESTLYESYDGLYERFLTQYRGGGSRTVTPRQNAIKKKVRVAIGPTVNRRIRPPRASNISQPTKQEFGTPQPGGLKILQISRTNCAGAFWRIHSLVNNLTPHVVRTVTAAAITNGRRFPRDIPLRDYHAVVAAIKWADVIHFHNFIDQHSREMVPFRELLKGKRILLQYHTEPQLLQRTFQSDIVNRTDIQTLTVAQKHQRWYPKSIPVPNMIDVDDKLMMPSGRIWKKGTPLKVIYTPSDKRSYPDYTQTCCGKGYTETLPILEKLQKEGLISFRMIDNMQWEPLMGIKRTFDVCIDECVTGGYHQAGLEALSQGLVTIGYLDHLTQEAIHGIVGEKTRLPWVNAHISELEQTLRRLAAMSGEELSKIRRYSREWMVEHWHPKKLVKHFDAVYRGETPSIETTGFRRAFADERPLDAIYRSFKPRLRGDLLDLAQAWKDREVVIWGNGPSAVEAASIDFDSDVMHIGTNAATMLRSHFDAYCIGDNRFFDVPEKMEIARNAPGIRVFFAHTQKKMGNDGRTSFIQCVGRSGVSTDPAYGFYHGYSVVWMAIQLALYAGVNRIRLAGCEFTYDSDQPRFYPEENPSPIDSANHRHILRNFQRLHELLQQRNIELSTIGESTLAEVGIPRR